MTVDSEKITKQIPKKDNFRADVAINGEPAEQANELLAKGVYGNKTELVRQGIRLLYLQWINHKSQAKTSDVL